MPILVDGHNLIPHVPGVRLSDAEDEMRLVELLQAYSRLRRRGIIECYFDNAPQGDWPQARRFGQVRAYFARRGSSADAEIERRLKRLGSQARGWLVVSSDRRVRAAARAAGARDQTSEDFARELITAIEAGDGGSTADRPAPSANEVDYWLSRFRQSRKRDGNET
jgi:predicted RNA-binding protein with PIN domain